MKRLVVLFLLITFYTQAQTGIGTTTPDASAKLEVASTNKGFLPPRVSLTATNVASPISNPANGLMVFNTASAGVSPFNVVPGYYYWDGVGLRWVSISTTVGNVQNQAIYRSSASTSTGNAVSSWLNSFNNLAAGDFTMTATTSFTLSNGFYKLEWALPYQSGGTYNDMLLQELISSTWGTFRNNDAYARIANGGSGNWGGGTFAADVVDCSTSSRTFRLYNADGASRAIFAGATLIITKLNPSITTSTTADNLGNHIATSNIQLNGNYLSNDGGNEGIRVDNSGNVGINNASPTQALDVTGSGRFSTSIINTGNRSYFGKDGQNMHWFTSTDGTETNNLGYGFESNGTSVQSHRWNIGGSERMRLNSSGHLGVGTTPNVRFHVLGSDQTTVYIESTTSDNNGMMILNANTNQNWANGWHEFLRFQNQGSTIGQVFQTNASTISYATTSDYRLKTDFKPFNGMALINKMKIYDYAWKIDNSRNYGVKAHELQEVLPYLVSGKKDEVDQNGVIVPQTVDYGKLTPVIIKALQEQAEKIETLENRIKKLESLLNKKSKK